MIVMWRQIECVPLILAEMLRKRSMAYRGKRSASRPSRRGEGTRDDGLERSERTSSDHDCPAPRRKERKRGGATILEQVSQGGFKFSLSRQTLYQAPSDLA